MTLARRGRPPAVEEPSWVGTRQCIFCLRVGVEMTREHVFAHWLVRKVHGARLFASTDSKRLAPDSEAPTRISRVVAPVCADCNAGWMSTLEVSFRQTLFAAPRVGLLQSSARITLSRWFAKTAVLLAVARGTEFLSAETRSRIVAGIPDDVEVFVGRRRRPRQALDYALELASDATTGVGRVRFVAVQVDDILGHVAARGTLTSAQGTRLWPLRSHTIRWETLPVITRPASRAHGAPDSNAL